MTSQTKSAPKTALAAAFLAAGVGGWVFLNGNPTPQQIDDDSARTIRVEIHTSDTATMVALANSKWRNEIMNVSRSVSKLSFEEIVVHDNEPISVGVIGRQTSINGRETVSCKIFDNGKQVVSNRTIVRPGDTVAQREVSCKYTRN